MHSSTGPRGSRGSFNTDLCNDPPAAAEMFAAALQCLLLLPLVYGRAVKWTFVNIMVKCLKSWTDWTDLILRHTTLLLTTAHVKREPQVESKAAQADYCLDFSSYVSNCRGLNTTTVLTTVLVITANALMFRLESLWDHQHETFIVVGAHL